MGEHLPKMQKAIDWYIATEQDPISHPYTYVYTIISK